MNFVFGSILGLRICNKQTTVWGHSTAHPGGVKRLPLILSGAQRFLGEKTQNVF